MNRESSCARGFKDHWEESGDGGNPLTVTLQYCNRICDSNRCCLFESTGDNVKV